MVRILKVKDLEERKRFLIARSEMYRQTLRLEAANIKYSLALLKRKLHFLKTTFRLVGGVAPLAALLFARKQARKKKRGGFLSRLLLQSGLGLLGRLRPLVQGFAAGRRPLRRDRSSERENISRVL
ncbi:MAG: hypothetical protein JWR19_2124 [Pedosphaera sp.]|nr:hypothetical protein [Pedosphaera sp.]